MAETAGGVAAVVKGSDERVRCWSFEFRRYGGFLCCCREFSRVYCVWKFGSCGIVDVAVMQETSSSYGGEGKAGRGDIVSHHQKKARERGSPGAPPKFTCMTLTGDDHRAAENS